MSRWRCAVGPAYFGPGRCSLASLVAEVRFQRNGGAICQWSKTQAIAASSSGETELNRALQDVSEMLGANYALCELSMEAQKVIRRVDASACMGMLLRTGAGKETRLSTTQVWVQ